MSEADSISNIRSLIHSPYWIAVARSLRGEEAEGLINFIDRVSHVWRSDRKRSLGARGTERAGQVVTLPELDERLRKQCLHLLYKICKTCRVLPTSYTLQQEPTFVGKIHCYGGFADISEGEYMGRRVAIKHLRFGTKDGFDKIFKVLKSYPTQ